MVKYIECQVNSLFILHFKKPNTYIERDREALLIYKLHNIRAIQALIHAAFVYLLRTTHCYTALLCDFSWCSAIRGTMRSIKQNQSQECHFTHTMRRAL